MHLITSALFLPSVAAYLKPHSQELLLRSYFVISVGWWITHGRPGFDLPGFFDADTAYPVPSNSSASAPVHDKVLPSATSFKASTPNPWLPIIEGAIVHPDDHYPKIQRALAHYGALYGTRSAGQKDFVETELKGAEKIDGTMWIRIAGLTHKRAMMYKNGYSEMGYGTWERRGFRTTQGKVVSE